MISKMDTPTSKLEEEVKNRIMYFVLGRSFRNPAPRDIIAFNKLDPSERYNCKKYLYPKILDLKNNFNFIKRF